MAYFTRGGRVCCPHCWQEITESERPDTRIPARLRLSQYHGVHLDPGEFERTMHSISDADLWAAVDAGRLGLVALLGNDSDPRISAWPGLPDEPLLSVSEFRSVARERPGLEDDILRQADDVARHRFGIWTFVHQFGPEVDFNHDFGVPGVKYGWHYWQWGTPLLCAYALTGNDRWAEAIADLFRQWYAQRDRVTDVVPNFDGDVIWYELGLAVRTPILVDALLLTGGSAAWDEVALTNLLRTIVGHCRWLLRCSQANPYHAYNWPIQTAVALAYAGAALPVLRETGRWRTQAREVVREHLDRDFLPDGGYQERTPNYTAYVLQLLATYSRLLGRFEPGPNGEERGMIERTDLTINACIGLWAKIATPWGAPPAVNDTHRENPLQQWLARYSPPTPLIGSAWFPQTGFAVMRSEARYLFLNVSPWCNHSHHDILSFECGADDAVLAVDPGIAEGAYGDPAHEAWYRASRSHNMLCVNETDPVRHLAWGEDVAWKSTPELDFLAATHKGYEELFGVVHRRHVLFVKPWYWLFLDRVWAARPGLSIDWFFHTPLAMRPTAEGWRSEGLSLVAADAGRYQRREGTGPADLSGLPNGGLQHQIGWMSFHWTTRGGADPEDIAVLVAPGQQQARIIRLPADAADPALALFLLEADGFRHRVAIASHGSTLREA